MQYTNSQVRAAILDTALLFETKPHLFDYWVSHTPECDSPGCAIGHICARLRVPRNDFDGVARVMGYRHAGQFYLALVEFEPNWEKSGSLAARALRAFADAKFPAVHSLDASYLKWRVSFVPRLVHQKESVL